MNERIKDLLKLREPFPASAISKLPKGGVMLDFVGHASVTDRLLSVDPEWTWEPVALDERGLPAMDYDAQGKPVGLWIRLTVCGVSRLGYGTCEARKMEPVKELIGDALRNAAMRFGVALELWSKAELESQHGENNHTNNVSQNGTHPQNGHRAAPRPEIPPQVAVGAGNGKKRGGMEMLVEKCERTNVGRGKDGKVVPNHLVNIIKLEIDERFCAGLPVDPRASGVVTAENWEVNYQLIREHEEKKNAVPIGVDEVDDSNPFADE